MKPEFRIREVTRYVITRHDEKGTKNIVECESLAAANELKSALALQADAISRVLPSDDLDLYDTDLEHSYNALRANDIRTFGQLRVMSKKQIRDLKGLGSTRLAEILAYLARYGIHL